MATMQRGWTNQVLDPVVRHSFLDAQQAIGSYLFGDIGVRPATSQQHKNDEHQEYPRHAVIVCAVTERSNAATEERLKSGHAVGGVSIV
jgi:hypothetical protein